MATYTVKQNDTLFQIAERLGVSTNQLLGANPGVSGIQPGVTLRIPTVSLLSSEPQTPRTDPEAGRPGAPTTYVPPTYIPTQPQTPRPDPEAGRPKAPTVPPTYYPPTSPQTPRPNPEVGRPGAPTVPPTYIPPTYDTPPVRYTGAQPVPRADLSQYNEPRRIGYVPPAQPSGQGLIPGALRVAQQIAPSISPQFVSPIVDYLRRLFYLGPVRRTNQYFSPNLAPALQNIADTYGPTSARNPRTGQVLPNLVDPISAGIANAANIVSQYDQPRPVQDVPLAYYTGANLGMTPTQIETAQRQGLLPTTGEMGESGWPIFSNERNYERSSIIEYYLDNGRLPVIIFEEDAARFGWTDEEMIAAGFVQDQFGDWHRGEMAPGDVQQAAGGGGGGGGSGRTSSRRSGRRSGGGGGGSYAYPQNFVGREIRGQSPTARTTRPARMGAVTWRI